jgi:hypothetical protein
MITITKQLSKGLQLIHSGGFRFSLAQVSVLKNFMFRNITPRNPLKAIRRFGVKYLILLLPKDKSKKKERNQRESRRQAEYHRRKFYLRFSLFQRNCGSR